MQILGNPLIGADEWSVDDDVQFVYHGTSSKHMDAILAEGLRSGSCFGTEEVARYFAGEECKESGGRRLILGLPLCRLDRQSLGGDLQMVEFPIFANYDVRECEWEELEEGNQDWQNSFRVYESIECDVPVPIVRGDVLGRHWQPTDVVPPAPLAR